MTEVITVAVPVVVAQCVDRTVVEEVAGDHTLAIVAVMVVAMTVAVKIVVADMAVAIVVIVMVAMIVVEAVVAASVKIADHPFLLEISHGHPPKKNLLIYSVNMEKLPISDSLWTVKQIAHVVSFIFLVVKWGASFKFIFLGMGFCELDSKESCQSVIDALNGYEVHGRELRVDHARPRN